MRYPIVPYARDLNGGSDIHHIFESAETEQHQNQHRQHYRYQEPERPRPICVKRADEATDQDHVSPVGDHFQIDQAFVVAPRNGVEDHVITDDHHRPDQQVTEIRNHPPFRVVGSVAPGRWRGIRRRSAVLRGFAPFKRRFTRQLGHVGYSGMSGVRTCA